MVALSSGDLPPKVVGSDDVSLLPASNTPEFACRLNPPLAPGKHNHRGAATVIVSRDFRSGPHTAP